MSELTYAIVTPARDEASRLPRLARALTRQTSNRDVSREPSSR